MDSGALKQQQLLDNCKSTPFEATFFAQHEFFALRVATCLVRQQLFLPSTGLEQQHNLSDATTGVVVTASAVIATKSAFREWVMQLFYSDSEITQYKKLPAFRQSGSGAKISATFCCAPCHPFTIPRAYSPL